MLDIVLHYLNMVIDQKKIEINTEKFVGSVTSTGALEFKFSKDKAGDIWIKFNPESTIEVTVTKFILLSLTGAIQYIRILKGNKKAIIEAKAYGRTKLVEVNLDEVREALLKMKNAKK
jgi:hypothetical protein